MRDFLLLFLLLVTGKDSSTGVESGSVGTGCTGGWIEFPCEYPKTNESIRVFKDGKDKIQSTQKDVWETKRRFSVYLDGKNKNVRVVVKQLVLNDKGTYKCENHGDKTSDAINIKLQVVTEKNGCQKTLNQTAYRAAKTTISCDFKGNDSVRFFCKENSSICEDILSTNSSPKSKGTFSLTETTRGFTVSISNVSSQDAGVYWCGEQREGSYRTARKKIQLSVKAFISNFTKSTTIGENLAYWCQFPKSQKNEIIICKGDDPSLCERPVSSTKDTEDHGRFSMKKDKVGHVTVTVTNVTAEDGGTYWCGAESSDPEHSNTFFHKLQMTVVRPTPTPPASSTQSTTTSESRGPQLVITAVACVSALLLLLFVLILILIYKRHLTNKRNAAAEQHVREDYVYEEIQERPQKPDSGNALNATYALADFPTNPSAWLHYSTLSFQNGSGDEALISSSAACEYSSVKISQSPAVDQSSAEDPLYSALVRPQEQ